jgi:hypothetical protein
MHTQEFNMRSRAIPKSKNGASVTPGFSGNSLATLPHHGQSIGATNDNALLDWTSPRFTEFRLIEGGERREIWEVVRSNAVLEFPDIEPGMPLRGLSADVVTERRCEHCDHCIGESEMTLIDGKTVPVHESCVQELVNKRKAERAGVAPVSESTDAPPIAPGDDAKQQPLPNGKASGHATTAKANGHDPEPAAKAAAPLTAKQRQLQKDMLQIAANGFWPIPVKGKGCYLTGWRSFRLDAEEQISEVLRRPETRGYENIGV